MCSENEDVFIFFVHFKNNAQLQVSIFANCSSCITHKKISHSKEKGSPFIDLEMASLLDNREVKKQTKKSVFTKQQFHTRK